MLQWRHNEGDGVSNHRRLDCLLNRLFRRRSKKTSKLRVTGLCEGNSPETGEIPAQRASNAEMFPFDDVSMGTTYMRGTQTLVITNSADALAHSGAKSSTVPWDMTFFKFRRVAIISNKFSLIRQHLASKKNWRDVASRWFFCNLMVYTLALWQ